MGAIIDPEGVRPGALVPIMAFSIYRDHQTVLDNVPYLSHICMSRYSLGLGSPRPRWSDGGTEG